MFPDDSSFDSIPSEQDFIKRQKESYLFHCGINIRFGEELKKTILKPPVIYAPTLETRFQKPTVYDEYQTKPVIATYNTGSQCIPKHESIAVIPPLCNCSSKV